MIKQSQARSSSVWPVPSHREGITISGDERSPHTGHCRGQLFLSFIVAVSSLCITHFKFRPNAHQLSDKKKKPSFRSTGQEQAVRTPDQGFQNKIPLFLCHPDREVASHSSAAHKHPFQENVLKSSASSDLGAEQFAKTSVVLRNSLQTVSLCLHELEAQNRNLTSPHYLVVKEKTWVADGNVSSPTLGGDMQLIRLLGPASGSGWPSPHVINWNQAADQQQETG